jgi:Mrp family chromosome partitioning ATPase
VLAAGNSTCNSCVVVESPAIASLLQEAARQYDLVIIDAPSISSNCDAHSLSQYSNGLVMVTRPFYTTIDALERTVVDLKKNNAPVIGFVINNADEQKQKSLGDRDVIKPKLPLLLGSTQTDNSHRGTEKVSQP